MEKRNVNTNLVAVLLVLVAVLGYGPIGKAGNLEPSSAPAPTMKTLDEVEPRTPIHATDLPLTINQSGSYYLAENITTSGGGISITVDGVSLDLSGFTLAGGTGTGIYVEAKNVSVTNGTVSGWSGFGVWGVEAPNSQFKDLRIYNNGDDGLSVGYSNIVKDCVSRDNAGTGISGESAVVVTNCTSYSNDSDGIKVGSDGIVKDCTSKVNTDDGIQIALRCLVQNNTITSNASGIHVAGTSGDGDNRIEGNLICNNNIGLDIDRAGNYVVDNTVKGNTDNYDIAEGNKLNILLCEVPETIVWPAMVTLAGTLKSTATDQHGITVDANDVTIDLGGHSLIGPGSGTKSGIYMNGRSNVEIRNGTVREFETGIDEEGFLGQSHRIIDVRSISNRRNGIYLRGVNHLVENCEANDNGDSSAVVVHGIYAWTGSTVTSNTANNNGRLATGNVFGINTGYGSTVTGNTAYKNGHSAGGEVHGINTGDGSTVTGNTAHDNGNSATGSFTYGISVGNGSTVTGNTVYENGDSANGTNVYGIRASYGSTVTGNAACYNGDLATGSFIYGIYARMGSTVTSNTAYRNGFSTTGSTVYGIFLEEYTLVDQNSAYNNGIGAVSSTNMDTSVTGCVYGNNVAP